MNFRAALLSDITAIQNVRNSVKENQLSSPDLVTDGDCAEFLTVRGRGWVCETESTIVGFAIVDLKAHNIWALFVHPDYENLGIGKKLQELMLNWYFENTDHPVWLGTAPGTRAEIFYELTGWIRSGVVNKGEVKFMMTAEKWKAKFD